MEGSRRCRRGIGANNIAAQRAGGQALISRAAGAEQVRLQLAVRPLGDLGEEEILHRITAYVPVHCG